MFNETQILRELNPVLRDHIVNSNCRELVDSGTFLLNYCRCTLVVWFFSGNFPDKYATCLTIFLLGIEPHFGCQIQV